VSNWWRQSILAVSSIGVSVLPKLACPACWPAYAGLLTSVGLGFLISVRYLLPLTVAFLVLALAAMLFRARDRHGYGPFLLAVLAAGGVLLGKFVWDSRPAVYGAIGLLVGASLWNSWPRRDTSNDAPVCSHCRKEELQ
jgi:mercuric ion transport protein